MPLIIFFSFLLSALLDYLGHGIGTSEFWVLQILLAALVWSAVRYGKAHQSSPHE